MASAGCLPLWRAQVIETPSVIAPVYQLQIQHWDNQGFGANHHSWSNILLCAVSRALGIPCRVVTNYESAHDTNSNLLVDCYYNEIDENISDDSIW